MRKHLLHLKAGGVPSLLVILRTSKERILEATRFSKGWERGSGEKPLLGEVTRRPVRLLGQDRTVTKSTKNEGTTKSQECPYFY